MTEIGPLAVLIERLQRLPGIGAKGAQRLAFYFLRQPRDDVDALLDAIKDVKVRITYCSTCHNITDIDPCFFALVMQEIDELFVLSKTHTMFRLSRGRMILGVSIMC